MNHRMNRTAYGIGILLSAWIGDTAFAADPAQPASAPDELTQALVAGTPYIDARYRYEFVDQDGLSKDAAASTLRTRFGYRTGAFKGFSGTLEIEDVSPIGAERYNDTINGKTAYPVVADPDGTEINQAFVQFAGLPATTLKYGRQQLVRNNHRFIGDSGWRQNNQTFDAATLTNASLPDTEIFYGYSYNVNRIFGDDSPVGDFNARIHMMDAAYSGLPFGRIFAYAYLLDIENSAANSSATYGINFSGKTAIDADINLLYDLEYARQSDYANNPTHYHADYYRIEPGVGYGGFTAKAGYEVLGSDGGVIGFATPLATLHKWNGWADKFLTTPATGLQDIYGSVGYKVGGVNEWLDGATLALIYHDFRNDKGGANFGTEWDFAVEQTIRKHYSVGLKFADYKADGFATDTTKLILSLGFKYN